MSRDIPIIFSAPMVRALLDGCKTMTRRPAWRLPGKAGRRQRRDPSWPPGMWPSAWQNREPGDRLWVQETWAKTRVSPIISTIDNPWTVYAACDNRTDYGGPWRSAAQMKRADSRLTLVVTATKVEPLLDISEADARAEGCTGWHNSTPGPVCNLGEGWTMQQCGELVSPAGEFQMLWSKLHPEWDGYSSPEVVALTFTVHKQNIDELPTTTAGRVS